ncbi:MAG TPA: glycosyltransferase family 87 protein, partial [Blastocatellia bacterium]|nr:glycosyltransferase family 87 protein [Blastocatellia bacterium]
MGKLRLTFLVIAVLASGLLFARYSGSDPQKYSNDFSVYYFASTEVIEGRDPYEHSLGSWTPYLYPPLLAEMMIPLALMPLPVAAFFWQLIGAASVASAAWMSAKMSAEMSARLASAEARPKFHKRFGSGMDSTVLVAVLSVILLARFVLDNLAMGQANTVVIFLAVAHVYCYQRERRLWSALALAVAISIKVTPALFLVYHLGKGRIKFVSTSLAVLAVVTLLSLAPFGSRAPEVFMTFAKRTLDNEQGFNLAYSGNQSLRGAIGRARGETADEARRASTPLSIIGSALLLALALAASRKAESEASASAPFFCLLVLLSPLSWKAHFVALMLPLAYLVAQAAGAISTRRRVVIISTLAGVFLLFNFTSPRVIPLQASEWADTLSLTWAGAMLVF